MESVNINKPTSSLLKRLRPFIPRQKRVLWTALSVISIIIITFISYNILSKKNPLSPAIFTAIDNEQNKNASNSAGKKLPNQTPLSPCFIDGKSAYQRGIPNNKYGMFMILSSPLGLRKQLSEISGMVNGNGGDWGYVYTPLWISHQMDKNQWSNFFTLTTEYHLIPIILLDGGTFDQNTVPQQLSNTAKFLNQFNWPSSCRIVSTFNEMNALEYWKDGVDPEGYARILNQTIDIFKKENSNFFILNGALNASARSGPAYLDEEQFLIRMNKAVPGILGKLDGWAAHSYPQPEFSGDYHNPPSWYGKRDQIKAYEWELELLQKDFNLTNLPVFITETGWAHKEGSKPKWQYKNSTITSGYFDDAYRNIWGPDDRIKAIIPFIFNHPDWPNFNWMNNDGYCYPQCDVLRNIPKVKGAPELK